jgi:hypothetical protein
MTATNFVPVKHVPLVLRAVWAYLGACLVKQVFTTYLFDILICSVSMILWY